MAKKQNKKEGLDIFSQERQNDLEDSDQSVDDSAGSIEFLPTRKKILELARQEILKTTMIVRHWIASKK